MGIFLLLLLTFIVTVLGILIFSPDMMSEKETYRAKVKDLWGIVKLCQTANFGQPLLELRPANRSVLLDFHFLDADRVSMSLPLKLKKQQLAKAEYIKLFSDHDLEFFDLENNLTVFLDRKDENLGELVAHLYRKIFQVSNTDTVKFTVKTLKSDILIFRHFKNPHYKFNDDATFEARSYRHKGKSLLGVLTMRILSAVNFLLYPPLVILSYQFWGVMVMCWAAVIFFSFFALYNFIYKKSSVAQAFVNGSILYCILLATTLATQNIDFLQSIPSVIGISTAVISGALALGIWRPKSKKNIIHKQRKPREFRFMHSIWFIGGSGLFLTNEWARRQLDIEQWIWFFGFVRIEFMLAMFVVFIPAYSAFLMTENNNSTN